MPILRGKRQAKECDSKLAQILDIADKHFKAAIINIFEELSKIIFNELKWNHLNECKGKQSQQKKINYKKNQMETLELTAKKNSLERFNCRMEMAERTSKLEASSIEITSTEE